MKDVPIGTDDFRKIRENDGYYVDKTRLIEEILSRRNTEAFLFTRPRRFGKSLNMSMLDAFFNIEYKGNRWFDGLYISGCPDATAMANESPVVSMTLKDLGTSDYSTFLGDLRESMREVCSRYRFLLRWETDSNAKDAFIRLYNGSDDPSELKASLKTMTRALEEYHGRPAIVLIDEYDSPVNSSFGRKSQKDILEFMRGFMSNALKSNRSLRFGVVTGVMQVTKESIFSGLNNLDVNSVFTAGFDEGFGFTEPEVQEMLSYYGHPEKMEEVRDWYDGYRFGNAEIYSPWSIVKYVSSGFRAETYWLDEGNPEMIAESVSCNGADGLRTVTDLYNGIQVRSKINRGMTIADVSTPDGLLSLLVSSGYAKAIPADDEEWEAEIVNKEVRKGLLEQLVRRTWTLSKLSRISKAILERDPESLRKELSDSLDRLTDSRGRVNEACYQSFVLGLLDCLKDTHYVRPEAGGGTGYADIVIVPRDGRGPSAVLELKFKKPGTKDEAMRAEASGAIFQIRDRRYFADLFGEVILYGLAFRQTDVFVSCDRILCRPAPCPTV